MISYIPLKAGVTPSRHLALCGAHTRQASAHPAAALQVTLQGHFKAVSALDVDRAGARVITGGMDYRVHLYDFNGMKADCRPFRELMPHDGHPVHALSFSPSGDAFLAVTGEPRPKARPCMSGATCLKLLEQLLTTCCCKVRQRSLHRTCCRCASCSLHVKSTVCGSCAVPSTADPLRRPAQVYGRDGHELGEFKRGDMYLRDMKNTKGHTSGCTGGHWHPVDKHTAMTCSTDGTVRLWDCEAIEQKMVIKPNAQGRVPVSACCYSADGTLIAGASWLPIGFFVDVLVAVHLVCEQRPRLFSCSRWQTRAQRRRLPR
jgi:WD40 repeat protein